MIVLVTSKISDTRSKLSFWLSFSLTVFLMIVTPLAAQKPLVEQDEYDLLKIEIDDEIKEYKIFPVTFPGGKVPTDPNPKANLKFIMLDQPGKEFEVFWKDVVSYQQFPQMLFDEAVRLTKQNDYDLAYRYFDRMLRQYPRHPQLPIAIQGYQFKNAQFLVKQKKYTRALALLEEVQKQNMDYPGLSSLISSVADILVGGYIGQENYPAAFKILDRYLALKQSSRFPFVNKWDGKLRSEAEKLKQQAEQKVQQQDIRTAYDLTKEMLAIYPRLSGGKEFYQELVRMYPLIQIATSSPPSQEVPLQTLTFSGARDRRLRYRTLTEFVGYGAEGGEYLSPYGSIVRAADGMQVSIFLRSRLTDKSGFELSRLLLDSDRAGKYSALESQFRQMIRKLSVEELRDVQIDLKNSHVRPESLMRFIPDLKFDPDNSNGPYETLENTGSQQLRYVLKEDYPWQQTTQTKEIVLDTMKSTRAAIEDLKSGKVDVVDRIYPADVQQLLSDESIVVDSYRSPSMHVLIPNFENPFLANRNFRRAILYAINRQDILQSRLLAGHEQAGSQVLSAAIPAGLNSDDPLAYGYNFKTEVRPYEPQMSAALLQLTKNEFDLIAKEKESEPPQLKELTIGHPDSEISREAISGIKRYLERIGLKLKVVIIDAELTDLATANVDLMYAELKIDEPLVDVPQMFQRYVQNKNLSPAFRLSLQNLGKSRSWQIVRQQFEDVHRLAHDELPIIPLWQIHDHFAYSKGMSGIGYQPMSLFQNIERWQSTPKLFVDN